MDYVEYKKAKSDIANKVQILERIRKGCESKDRGPNATERRKSNKLFVEIDQLEQEIEGYDRAYFEESTEEPHRTMIEGSSEDRVTQTNRARTGSDVNYRNLFGPPVQHDNGFDSFSEFLQVVASNRYSDRLITRTQNIGSPSDGGFLLQDDHAQGIMDMALAKSLIWKSATVYPMASSELKVPAISDTDHSASRGGLVAMWKAEEAEFDLDSIELRQLEFSANKLTLLIKCSREFLEDGIAAEQFVRNTMSSEMGYQMDHVALNAGSGAGMPLSILNSGALIETAKEAGQAAETLIWLNVTDMAKSFNPAAGESGMWVISPSLRGQVFEMSQAVGTGGSSVHPNPSQVKERGLSLLGFPVHFSEHCNVAGTKGDIFLINPKAYAYGLRADVRIEASNHVAFTSDQVVFRATMRVDGMPIHAEPLTLSDGSSTVSDFVTLAERS